MQNPCDHRNFDAVKNPDEGTIYSKKVYGIFRLHKESAFFSNFVALSSDSAKKGKLKNIYFKYGMVVSYFKYGRILSDLEEF